MQADASIGIFDSGFGGLTVLRAIRRILPKESLLYFGDTARLPYGNKSPDSIRRFVLESIQFFLNAKIKLLVVACNTACSCSFELFQNQLPFPVVGVIHPAIQEIALSSKQKKVAILGTRTTIAAKIHERELLRLQPRAEIISIACPLFVPLIEEGYIDHPATDLFVKEILAPLETKNIDTILLACTHYPLLKRAIQNAVGSRVDLIDPAFACANSTKKILVEQHLSNPNKAAPSIQFCVSDDPEKFKSFGSIFLGEPIEHVTLVNLSEQCIKNASLKYF